MIFHVIVVEQMLEKDFIQFEWTKKDSQDEPILIVIDEKSSVVPKIAVDLATIFNCCK